jgi:hypothetical protein
MMLWLSLQDAVIQGNLSLSEKILHQAMLLSAPIFGASDNRFHFSFIDYFYRMDSFKDVVVM